MDELALRCAQNVDGTLRDASQINWFNNRNDELLTSGPDTSSSQLHPFFTGAAKPVGKIAGARQLRNKLTAEVFEVLQLLKCTYRNGRISAAKDAAKHMDTLIAELDEEHYGFPADVVDMMELDGDEYIM
ncbi:hypothetical protein C8J57DRAFT_1529166 [Mycena rebaudengoi]|nr:hypothetical protein C8J57DRAFT_1529166 [Mycena rebaudengoi]